MKTYRGRLISLCCAGLWLGGSACGSSGSPSPASNSNVSGGSSGASGNAVSASGSNVSGSSTGGASGDTGQTGPATGSSTGSATATGNSGDTSGDSASTGAPAANTGDSSGDTSGATSDIDASVPEAGNTSGSTSGSASGSPSVVVAGDGGTTGGGGTCATLIARPTCSGPAGAYHNPAMGNIGTHDPSVVKDNCTFYMFETNHSVTPAATSTDLINWKSISAPAFPSPAWWAGANEIWAPDVHFANGKFWNYYTLEHPNSDQSAQIKASQIGLATSVTIDPTSPNYNWQDQGLVIDQPTGGGSNVNCIDPDLFIDDDGTWWLSYGSFNGGIRLLQLDPATGLPMKPISPTMITSHLGEGSSLIKHNGWYYSFVSRGKCCAGTSSSYEIIYARSKTIKGPYTTKSGQNYTNSAYTDATDALLQVGADGNTGGEGGQSFFKENGQWYMDYHTYNPGAQGLADLDVRPIYFDSTDWVTFDCSKGTP